MLNKNTEFNEFQYVVEKIKPQRVCFGSGLERDTNLFGKGLSSFQKRYIPELFKKTSPASYNCNHLCSGVAMISNKISSIKGVPGLINGEPRWSDKITRTPSPTRYTVAPYKKTFKKSFAPFGCHVGRRCGESSQTPGPGMYKLDTKSCRRSKIDYNFGQPKPVPAVEVECNPLPTNRCDRCGDICQDDYWHQHYTTFLCHVCMEEEKVLRDYFTISELKKYEKIRICSYKHSHEGVQACRQLWTKNRLKKRDRLENYLDLYISSI
ncbi:hypothetical protein FQR65_LT02392 [Abscondita terminalis]|nr:hypothetical protein FQR65_LT02392 [Abscondita terminalis]